MSARSGRTAPALRTAALRCRTKFGRHAEFTHEYGERRTSQRSIRDAYPAAVPSW
jgi:hypothetical protein